MIGQVSFAPLNYTQEAAPPQILGQSQLFARVQHNQSSDKMKSHCDQTKEQREDSQNQPSNKRTYHIGGESYTLVQLSVMVLLLPFSLLYLLYRFILIRSSRLRRFRNRIGRVGRRWWVRQKKQIHRGCKTFCHQVDPI